jgi:hypothetical protein
VPNGWDFTYQRGSMFIYCRRASSTYWSTPLLQARAPEVTFRRVTTQKERVKLKGPDFASTPVISKQHHPSVCRAR